jgi:alkanesulfonate monooxygenase SsuD/methylene tetrahydromethanopterin reductase-like flavin-dependent oxidoreductase (luciferase family)
MNLGVLIESEEGLDWERWQSTCLAAERLGFESLWVSDHLASPWSEHRHGLEPWVALSVAASQTRRIRLGSLVSPITFRQPALMARMAEAIDDLGPGRFVLGLGLGWNAEEHARFGIPFPGLADRARMLADGITAIRRVHGERHIPLLLGGAGLRSTLPLVARFADEWNVTTASADFFRVRNDTLDTLCAQAERDPHTIRRSIAAGVLVGRDADELRERSRRMQSCVPPLAHLDLNEVPRAAADMGWLVGTPAAIVAALRPLADAGVDLAIVGHYDLHDAQTLELIMAEVAPNLA